MIISQVRLGDFAAIKTVYTVCCFDLFHEGHADYLERIKRLFPEHKLVVGVKSDAHITIRKGAGRPIMRQRARLRVVDAIKHVDYAFICYPDRYTLLKDIHRLRPVYYVSQNITNARA